MSAPAVQLWMEAMWRACWQGGIAICVVWAVCRVWRGQPPHIRCWLWRLAYAKLLLALLWAAPVDLPVLSPRQPRAGVTSAPQAPLGAFVLPLPSVSAAGGRDAGSDAARLPAAAATAVALAWLLGFACVHLRLAAEWRAVSELRRSSRPLAEESAAELVRRLCVQMGLSRPPLVLLSDVARSPMLIGWLSPAVVLPRRVLNGCTDDELRLILAHELAHMRQRHLIWGWLATAVHSLFFFHPLLWLANREWRLAHELACDEACIRATNAEVAEYGRALVKVASGCNARAQLGLAAGADESLQALRRRLVAMKWVMRKPSRGLRTGSAAVVVAVALAMVPWRVVAQTTSANPPKKAPAVSPQSAVPAKLGLTEAQAAQVKQIAQTLQDALRQVKTDTTLADQDKAARAKAAYQSADQALAGVLAPDQMAKLLAIGGAKAILDGGNAELAGADNVLAKLRATDAQAAAIRQVVAGLREQLAAVSSQPGADKQDAQQAAMALMQAAEAQVAAVLDDRQRKALADMGGVKALLADAPQETPVSPGLLAKLGLDNGQTQQVVDVLASLKSRIAALSPSGDAGAFVAAYEANLTDADATIAALLGDQQKARFIKIGGVRGLLVGSTLISPETALAALNLGEAQVASIKQVLADINQALATLKQQAIPSGEDQKLRLTAILNDADARINAVLSEEQATMLAKLGGTPVLLGMGLRAPRAPEPTRPAISKKKQ